MIIPTYRGGQKLLDCLDTVLDQTRPADEVIVVDSSDDESPDLVRSRFGDRVKLIHMPQRVPSGEARGLGVREATGDVVAFTDDDCLADQHWLEELAKPYDDPEVVWAGGSVWPHNSNPVARIDFWAGFSQWLTRFEGRTLVTRAPFNLSYRRDTYLALLDASTGFALEDRVFNLRFERAHSRPAVAPKAFVSHRDPHDLKLVLARHRRVGNLSVVGRAYDPSIPGSSLVRRRWVVPLLPWGREVFFWGRLFRYAPREGLSLLPHAWVVHRVFRSWYRGLLEAHAEGSHFQWRSHEWGTHDAGAPRRSENP